MIIKTLEELCQADDRTLHFTPMGLGLGVRMRPEGAAEFQQQVVAQFDLAPQVAESTRKSFEDLRTAFAHGLFCYEIFTLVNDRGLLVLEQALRDRFIAHHGGTVRFVDERNGTQHAVATGSYHELHDVVRKNPRRRLLLDGGQTIAFNGMLGDLRTWARRLGLLRGQRNRAIEQAISDLRNLAAHPAGYHLTTPVEAARTLSDLAEIINHLWGVATPGGRLYPAPHRRDVVVVAWDTAGTQLQMGLADELATAVDPAVGPTADPADPRWRAVIVRAVFRADQGIADPGLRAFDSRYEVTQYPADLLWGPGSLADAAAWTAEHQPEADECDYLDRTFVVRYDGTSLYWPMRPSVAAALPNADQNGYWYAIKADHPNEAYHHVRTRITATGCARRGPCQQCHAETLHTGHYQQVMAAISDPVPPTPSLPPDAATPWAHPRVRVIL
ncbi:hypothetical protein ACFQVD_30350 [Streptosporangium amethystogenes subsp. fukuiense]|uniref:Uncharacterized protein n=1 Tax=Streptosporangium amethystogenes subsp. fukuiense TaxID=698418 RepID=A0ABW2T811_9ACTN